MLGLKSQRKRHFIFASTFSWLNNLLKQGSQRALENDDLPPLLKEDDNEALTKKLEKEWSPKLQSLTHYGNMDKDSNTLACSLEPSASFREGVSPQFSAYAHCPTSSATFVSNWTAGRTNERTFR